MRAAAPPYSSNVYLCARYAFLHSDDFLMFAALYGVSLPFPSSPPSFRSSSEPRQHSIKLRSCLFCITQFATVGVGIGPSDMHFSYPQYDKAGHSLLVSVYSYPCSTSWTSPFSHIISWSVEQIWNHVRICFFFCLLYC